MQVNGNAVSQKGGKARDFFYFFPFFLHIDLARRGQKERTTELGIM